MSWLQEIGDSNNYITDLPFDPTTAVGSIHINEAKGSISYYMSNIYEDEEYFYLNEGDSSNKKVRISKDDFIKLPRTKESIKSIIGFYLKLNVAGLDY